MPPAPAARRRSTLAMLGKARRGGALAARAVARQSAPPPPQALYLEARAAADLPSRQMFGAQDPYVRFVLQPGGAEVHRSRPCEAGGAAPAWGSRHANCAAVQLPPGCEAVEAQVWNSNVVTDDLIASAVVPLAGLPLHGPSDAKSGPQTVALEPGGLLTVVLHRVAKSDPAASEKEEKEKEEQEEQSNRGNWRQLSKRRERMPDVVHGATTTKKTVDNPLLRARTWEQVALEQRRAALAAGPAAAAAPLPSEAAARPGSMALRKAAAQTGDKARVVSTRLKALKSAATAREEVATKAVDARRRQSILTVGDPTIRLKAHLKWSGQMIAAPVAGVLLLLLLPIASQFWLFALLFYPAYGCTGMVVGLLLFGAAVPVPHGREVWALLAAGWACDAAAVAALGNAGVLSQLTLPVTTGVKAALLLAVVARKRDRDNRWWLSRFIKLVLFSVGILVFYVFCQLFSWGYTTLATTEAQRVAAAVFFQQAMGPLGFLLSGVANLLDRSMQTGGCYTYVADYTAQCFSLAFARQLFVEVEALTSVVLIQTFTLALALVKLRVTLTDAFQEAAARLRYGMTERLRRSLRLRPKPRPERSREDLLYDTSAAFCTTAIVERTTLLTFFFVLLLLRVWNADTFGFGGGDMSHQEFVLLVQATVVVFFSEWASSAATWWYLYTNYGLEALADGYKALSPARPLVIALGVHILADVYIATFRLDRLSDPGAAGGLAAGGLFCLAVVLILVAFKQVSPDIVVHAAQGRRG